MSRYRLYQVDSFTTEKFRGNPAGVVPNADGLTESQMQTIAREMNNSETAFILSPTGPDHEVWVRFFTPTTEVPSCGHATIAAHYVRALEKQLPPCSVIQKIGAGILPVEVENADGDYRIVMTQGAISFGPDIPQRSIEDLLLALDITHADLDDRCPIQIVSTGHSKVLIGIKSRSLLDQLSPDLAALTQISQQIGCNGYYVFVLTNESDIRAHGRMFAPAIGIPEDPVTGNANGPLGAYLVQHGLVDMENGTYQFTARQGEAIGRPGEVDVVVTVVDGKPQTVQVGGRAVVVFKTELEL